MTEIKLTDTAKLTYDGLQYMPYYWQESDGTMVRAPKTGEMVKKQSKWVHTGSFHPNIADAVRKLAVFEVLKKDEYDSLKDYVEAFQNAYKELDV